MNYQNIIRQLILMVLVALFVQCSGSRHVQKNKPSVPDLKVPQVQREFRAAWIATVANINWPSKPGLTVKQQKEEAIALLDFLKDNNFNAVIFQVRPQCDALYNSEKEPWSYFLTGAQGEKPVPYYDPLDFWIEEAHKRALEFHAWFNPYRAHHTSGGAVSENSIVKTHPELVVKLENGFYWMIPTEQGTQDHSYNVVMDVVKRYNVDGIHFDDYFYPYPSYHKGKDFPDDASWKNYTDKGGKLSRGDWRRDAVNQFMKRIYKGIKSEKPHVKFGLSPFGVWRPNHPESIKGLDQYDALYADAKLWLNKGWVDYWTPQLYWPVNQVAQSFPVLVGWWESQNFKQRHFWPGISPKAKAGSTEADEAFNQVMITRGMLSQSPGIVYWNINSLLKSEELTQTIKNGPFQQPALVPASPWLGKQIPDKPIVELSEVENRIGVKWTMSEKDKVASYVFHYKYGEVWYSQILGRNESLKLLEVYRLKTEPLEELMDKQQVNDMLIPLNQIAVQSVNVFGQMSEAQLMDVKSLSENQLPSLDELKALIKEEQLKLAAQKERERKQKVNLDLKSIIDEGDTEVEVLIGSVKQTFSVDSSKVINIELNTPDTVKLLFQPREIVLPIEKITESESFVLTKEGMIEDVQSQSK
ncbi:MAG: family 10 glycosylhydrolase [Carboxylicivirga sp.]|jgi:uncharacterized lipoprotein YddW (UPF0748 family)|nr:family 10 glycosylhydrolase [Carboxylicivirga sp.]